MTFVGRTIKESTQYTKQVKLLGGASRLDEALNGVIWAISNNPEVFDLVPGFGSIRIAKTDEKKTESGAIIPRLRVWFRIPPNNPHEVELLYIEHEDSGA